jgi:hypothetical protein
MLLALCATTAACVTAGCRSSTQPPRHHEDATLTIADKQEPGYSSDFRLGARRNVGTATLSSGHQFKFVCEFIRMTEDADVYTLDLSVLNGTNIVKTIRFNGKAQLIYETDKERIEIQQPTKPSTTTN